MKKLAIILVLPILLSVGFEILPVLPNLTPVAEAARFGGGRSFGGSSSFGRSAIAPGLSRPAGQAQNLAGTAGMAGRGGLMGGMFGPLLAGSMLGALFFGGAFSGIGMADIAMILLALWMISRLLRSRRAAPAHDARQSAEQGNGYPQGQNDVWAHLRSNPNQAGAQQQGSQGFTAPAGFDEQKFMDGARIIYNRMQESWDKRDLSDIEQFTTPAMFKLVQEQAKEDPTPSSTTVLTMSAEPHEFKVEGDKELISVYFDALLREYDDKDAENALEIWHFSRPIGQGTWKLDGIQQVE